MEQRIAKSSCWEMHWTETLYKLCFFSSYFSDLTGAQDGSVRMFEWGHSQQIICFRSPGNSRVTRIRFNHQGNKVRKSLSYCMNWTHTYQHADVRLLRLHCDVRLSVSAAFPHFLSQVCHSGMNHSGEFGISTHCSPAEWFNCSELRHTPQANNFLRWCLPYASAILSACSGQKSKICF